MLNQPPTSAQSKAESGRETTGAARPASRFPWGFALILCHLEIVFAFYMISILPMVQDSYLQMGLEIPSAARFFLALDRALWWILPGVHQELIPYGLMFYSVFFFALTMFYQHGLIMHPRGRRFFWRGCLAGLCGMLLLSANSIYHIFSLMHQARQR